jgi:hypothetical protein
VEQVDGRKSRMKDRGIRSMSQRPWKITKKTWVKYAWLLGYKKGEEIQTKSIDNLSNYIIADKFPNLKKGREIHVQEAFRMPNKQVLEKKHLQKYYN